MNANSPNNRRARALVVVLLAIWSGAAAKAGEGDARKFGYDKIAQRNVFGLVSAPDGVVADTARPSTPAQVKLSGITTVLGQKRAFFVVHGAPENGKAREESYMLTVGERQNGYELLDVDEKAGAVRLRADGRVLVLNLASPKLPTAAVAPAAPAHSQATVIRPIPARAVAHTPAEAPSLPPVPGVPDTTSSGDSKLEPDLLGRP